MSVTGVYARIHVATFDATGESPTYNRGNCNMVVRYMLQQPGGGMSRPLLNLAG
jgi:hypothetical protein